MGKLLRSLLWIWCIGTLVAGVGILVAESTSLLMRDQTEGGACAETGREWLLEEHGVYDLITWVRFNDSSTWEIEVRHFEPFLPWEMRGHLRGLAVNFSGSEFDEYRLAVGVGIVNMRKVD
jgi:hypothetical protein